MTEGELSKACPGGWTGISNVVLSDQNRIIGNQYNNSLDILNFSFTEITPVFSLTIPRKN